MIADTKRHDERRKLTSYTTRRFPGSAFVVGSVLFPCRSEQHWLPQVSTMATTSPKHEQTRFQRNIFEQFKNMDGVVTVSGDAETGAEKAV